MKKINLRHIWQSFYYSLPVQLIAVQLAKHKAILLFWLFLLAAVYGMIAGAFGGAYLFLEPEYLGKENFWSSFIVGSALGAFLFAYMITLYINESYRFHFIALSKNPFYTFAFNNSLIPSIFLSLYFIRYINFHIQACGAFNWEVIEKFAGLFMGINFVFLLSASYFFAQRTIFQYFGQRIQSHIQKQKSVQDKRVILEKARKSYRSNLRADSYLLFPLKVVNVSETPQNFRSLVYTLSQHHGKLLMLQISIFLLIATLGLLEENPKFQLPVGASILLILSLMLMISGALKFWFRKIGLWAFWALILVGYVYQSFDLMHEKHQAFGLSYKEPHATYSKKRLEELGNTTNYKADKEVTVAMLDRWKALHQEKYGKTSKPKAVFVSASGGGLRSAFWTFRTLQYADSITNGKLKEDMRLMTGASGGMFGLAYFRELHMRYLNQEISNIYDIKYTQNISKDLLNRISFKYFADLFLPNRIIKLDGEAYHREAGYAFDHQVALNMPEFKDRKLGDYAYPESMGLVPTVILTPTILNQGRKLYVSASPVSFLAHRNQITEHYNSKGLGVEFRRMFANQKADSLWMTTALRMNATFPYILPIIQLPSNPPMTVMDAGAMDNYGMPTSVKYVYEFREWFEKNTDGIVFIQIRDNEREDPIVDIASQNNLSQIFTPLGGGYYSITESRDLSNQYLLQFLKEWFDGKIEIISLEYPQESISNPASLSFHLTQREKKNIYQSINNPLNQPGFAVLRKLYPSVD